jgi:hypothetical protein
MPVIQDMQKAEIRRIMVPGQPTQTGLKDPISMEKMEKSWEWWHMPTLPIISVMEGSIR